MVSKRVRPLHLVLVYHFQRLVQYDAGSCDVSTLLIETAQLSICVPAGVAVLKNQTALENIFKL